MLKENIPRLQSLTKQKEFKELLKRHLDLATRNERTRLTRGAHPRLLELLELLDSSTPRLLDAVN
jgi:hypothetical protein